MVNWEKWWIKWCIFFDKLKFPIENDKKDFRQKTVDKIAERYQRN